jgi:enoyl-CoA hydratase/carnithine racemase
MDYETILFEVEDRIAVVTLNRPERLNAWNEEMGLELGQAMRRCDEDDEIRAVVITGKGRAFCAGQDLTSGESTFSAYASDRERIEATMEAARRYDGYPGPFPFHVRKPVLAAINGHAIGVGITYPMTCDIRFVAEDAKIQFAFARRGVLPELWSHLIVPRVAGLSNAADLLLTARVVRGREFCQMRLASAALPADKVLPAAKELARKVIKSAPVSVAISKRLLWKGLGMSLGELGPKEALMFGWTATQADSQEGVVAFLEKRDPRWKLRVSRDMPDFEI